MEKIKLSLRKIKVLVTLIATLLLLFLFAWDPFGIEPFWAAEYWLQDTVFQEPGRLHPDIMIFGIDEYSMAEFGPFHQWDIRGLIAEAINILNSVEGAEPAVIGIDILFAEAGNPESDAALADAARRAGNVVTASLAEVGVVREFLTLEQTIVALHTPFPSLMPYINHGLVNGIFDRDSVIRNALLRAEFNDEMLFSMPAVIAMEYLGQSPEDFMHIPTDTYIRFSGLPGDFFEGSFSDIFEDWFDPWWTAGAIVMIGPYAPGMLDSYPVSVAYELMHGVEILANVVQVVLDEAYKARAAGWLKGIILGALIIISMLIGEFVRDIRIMLGSFVVIGVGYFFGATTAYENGYVFQLFMPPVVQTVIFLYHMIYGYVIQAIEKTQMRNVFQKYVDPKLVNTLIESGEADSNSIGKRRHIAVVFVDVRGFTPMTEAMKDTPEKIVETLNEYLELTSKSVFNNGGSVDKFVGDATMALFNGFVPLEDYVYKAVKSAWDMVEGAGAVNAAIKERLGIDLGFGVGVHCGEAIVGNLGPSFRKDYTAIGDSVNTAARLESNAQRSQVLISRDVYELLADRIEAESIGAIPLKGKTEPLEVFALVGLK